MSVIETSHERIGAYLIHPWTSAETKANLARYVAIEDQDRLDLDAARASHVANPVPALREEVLDRAEKHVLWHSNRGREHCLEAPEITESEDGVLSALAKLSEAETEENRTTTSESADEAISNWKHVLEERSDGPGSPSLHQCAEVDQGDLRSLLRCIDALDFLGSADAASKMTPDQIKVAVMDELFACPQYPPEIG